MNLLLFQILIMLRQAERTATELRHAIRQLDNRTALPPLSSFYRALNEGVDAGWLEIRRGESGGRGRPRQSYQLTERGMQAARSEAEHLADLAAIGLAETAPSRSD